RNTSADHATCLLIGASERRARGSFPLSSLPESVTDPWRSFQGSCAFHGVGPARRPPRALLLEPFSCSFEVRARAIVVGVDGERPLEGLDRPPVVREPELREPDLELRLGRLGRALR